MVLTPPLPEKTSSHQTWTVTWPHQHLIDVCIKFTYHPKLFQRSGKDTALFLRIRGGQDSWLGRGYKGPQASRENCPLGHYSCKWGWQLKQDLKWTGNWGHWGNFIFSSCGRQTKSLLKMSMSNPCNLWICNITQQKELWIKVTDHRPYLRIRQRVNPGSLGWAQVITWVWKGGKGRQKGWPDICNYGGRGRWDLKCGDLTHCWGFPGDTSGKEPAYQRRRHKMQIQYLE